MISYADLLTTARQRLAASGPGKTRVIVQVGHCSQSVGAKEVAEAMQRALSGRSHVQLVVTGCDGACFAAPQVVVVQPSGVVLRHAKVQAAQVPELVERLSEDPGRTSDANQQHDVGDDLAEYFDSQHRRLLSQCGWIDPANIDEYIVGGGYRGLAEVLTGPPEATIAQFLEAGLLGRGGAYFPAARKWEGVRSTSSAPRYVVVNAEEGEPGLFKDRHIMEGDPHRLLEGMLIAAYAAGATQGYIYINAEAELSAQRMETAVEQARSQGLLGENIFDSSFDFDAEIRRGAGGYVCGEETTMLETIQGSRREPRLRPPFPTESGLFFQPTVINNVETLVNVPLILEETLPASEGSTLGEEIPSLTKTDPGVFSVLGLDSAKGTKLICLSGSVQRPGLVEVPLGTTLREVIFQIGGGPPGGQSVGFVAVGGPSSGVLPVSELDTPLAPGMLHPSGVVMGAGGIMVLDDGVPVIDVVRRLAAYNASESCGKCTPCREGTPRMAEALERLASGQGSPDDLDELRYLAEIVGAGSLCGLGQMAGGPINSALHFFGDELGRLAGVQ